MKKNNRLAIILLSFLVVGFVSCKKNQDKNQMNAADKNNPVAVMQSYFVEDPKQSDFTVFVSTVHPVSLFQNYPLTRSATTVEAFGLIGNENLGALTINKIRIPMDNHCYYLPVDTPMHNASLLTGVGLDYSFASTSPKVPTFNLTKYSPRVTNLTFNGLVDNKLSRTSNLTVSWLADDQMVNGKGLVIIMGSSDVDNATLITKEVDDNQGSVSITVDELGQFQNYASIKVYYSRGYYSDEVVSGKSLLFQFINYSWSRIYFSN